MKYSDQFPLPILYQYSVFMFTNKRLQVKSFILKKYTTKFPFKQLLPWTVTTWWLSLWPCSYHIIVFETVTTGWFIAYMDTQKYGHCEGIKVAQIHGFVT